MNVPFTFAHAAAVLPFRRSRLNFSGLVIGAFAPDFEYFLRLAPSSGFGHTLPGIFVLTLPLSVLVFWMFHNFVKRPFVALLPCRIRVRLETNFDEFHFGGRANIVLILASLLLGIATHAVWDSFTHAGTWPYRHIEVLRRPIHLPMIGWVQLYKIFQHSSTILGLAILACCLLDWCRKDFVPVGISAPASTGPEILTIVLIFGIGTLGAAIRAIAGVGLTFNHAMLPQFAGEFVVTAVALVWWQLVAYGALLSSRRNKVTGGTLPDLQ